MKCNGVERWLDDGMPDVAREEARRHIEDCARCTEAFEAARAVDAALGIEPLRAAGRGGRAPLPSFPSAVLSSAPSPSASSDFLFNVMARIDAAEAAVKRVPLGSRRLSFWAALATDPISAVSLTVALLITGLTAMHLAWIVDAGTAIVAWSWWRTAEAALHAPTGLDPIAWIGIGMALTPLVCWGLWAIYHELEA